MELQQLGTKNPSINMTQLDLRSSKVNWNLDRSTLTQQTLRLGQGKLSDTGALCVSTGKFTGRSPKDKFIVKDSYTEQVIDWGDINIPIETHVFDNLYLKMIDFLAEKEVWIRNCFAGADTNYRLNVTVVNTTPWANLFCSNLFISPTEEEIHNFQPGWLILQIPEFLSNPNVDGTRKENFTIINFSKKTILIGGSAYTGEIKKGIFSVLNFLLPHHHNILPMHCSANEGKTKDVALFFGLSGTGKTTLSADSNRSLIGDDEHGWAEGSIFNFEGGCYAKCIDLSVEKEPEIFAAVKENTLLENTSFFPNSTTVNYTDSSITENTRAAYPIEYITNAKKPSLGGNPKNIFFLTCDAFGILPPISKLTKEQAMYHFISGYTAKVAGTEIGVVEPQTTFSACFGRVFLPLHPIRYAELLGEKLEKHPEVNVWLVNTGWTGGPYGIGRRISLKYTRAMINAAINGDLDEVAYKAHTVFGVLKPQSCPNVPSAYLNPRNTWENTEAYDQRAFSLAQLFVNNFKQFEDRASEAIRSAAPKTSL
ncbi:phosphoenolpyruvate carboxykinase (ATP) [Sphingobacterium alkalisoli]|uniref:Phosphoenolpyruvate carboxykinase (ATP) n=1 Tax=Sphingobacterium alkalisoli TaxID=1874115 RepID=A0A4U0H9I5_9SPHI|nr:phosphoenolpyruvate carboxykinase (ATP) [Sphingobacterium alkalisoli]TJY68547.1 phosphoenolpyruvate carboxykinase (ATP) [Sphingobacterium alkalisoli]